ncbi:hypothetical protein ACTFIW_002251 [Dictyostelium discoideum]
MKFREKIICICLVIFSLLTLIATIIIVVFDLLPSMKFAKTYIPSDCKVVNHYFNTTVIPSDERCMELNNDVWWYNKLGANAFYYGVIEHKVKDSNNNNNTNNTTDGGGGGSGGSSSSDSNSEYGSSYSYSYDEDSSLGPNEKICFQGLFEVEYSDQKSSMIVSNISGLWSPNWRWCYTYLKSFGVGNTDNCFYESTDIYNANWFGPSKYSIFSIVGICVGGGFSLICLILFIYFYRRFSRVDLNSYIRISPDGTHIFY